MAGVTGTARGRAPRRRRRSGWPTWLALALLVVPLLELFVLIQVGQLIGAWPTLALLVLESALGAWLLRREGPAAWRRLQEATQQGRVPSTELADAALVLVGGTLLLTPGFATDVVGFFCVLPPTRPLARRLLLAAVRRRVVVAAYGAASRRTGPAGRHPTRPDVVQGEVVDGEAVRDSENRPRPGG